MQRTNIYLEERQARALDDLARSRRTTRAALVRQLVDAGLDEAAGADLESDIAAIEASFGVLGDMDADDEAAGEREPDARARHLEEVSAR